MGEREFILAMDHLENFLSDREHRRPITARRVSQPGAVRIGPSSSTRLRREETTAEDHNNEDVTVVVGDGDVHVSQVSDDAAQVGSASATPTASSHSGDDNDREEEEEAQRAEDASLHVQKERILNLSSMPARATTDPSSEQSSTLDGDRTSQLEIEGMPLQAQKEMVLNPPTTLKSTIGERDEDTSLQAQHKRMRNDMAMAAAQEAATNSISTSALTTSNSSGQQQLPSNTPEETAASNSSMVMGQQQMPLNTSEETDQERQQEQQQQQQQQAVALTPLTAAQIQDEYADRILGPTVYQGEVVNEETSRRRTRNLKQQRILAVLFAAILLTIAAITGVSIKAVKKNKDSPSIDTSPAPTPSNTILPSTTLPEWNQDQLDLLTYLKSLSYDNGTRLMDPESIEYQAFEWVAVHLDLIQDVVSTKSFLATTYALTALYLSTNGTNWFRNGGYLDAYTHICDWFPANDELCRTEGDISRIGFGSNNLRGQLPTTISKKVFPRAFQVNFNRNQLTGSIPIEIFTLDTVEEILMPQNLLTGTLPPDMIGKMHSRLISFDLHDNLLSGALPSEIGELLHVKYLELSNNLFNSTIPTEIGNLTRLTEFQLNNNQDIVGSIPSEIGFITTLRVFDVSSCSLSSTTIPTEFYQLSKLSTIRLGYNGGLGGTLSSLVGNLSSLEVLEIQNNNFSGTIPTELGLLTNLRILRFDGNNFTGGLPTELELLPFLSVIET